MPDLRIYEKKFRSVNRFLLVVFWGITCGCMLMGLRRGDEYATVQAGLALIMFALPVFLARFMHFSVSADCRLLYYVFIFSTIVVGSAMYGYSWIPYWDKLLHFFSGILISAVGLIVCHLLFRTLSGARNVRYALYILFPFCFNLSVAALWEIYEYILYILLGIDAVNHLTSGVHDTMQDIIVCFLGGILFTSLLLRAFYKGKYGFILNVCRNFFELRGEKLEF